ncbi:hypothetical protein BB559_005988 [Furculomyces boomerangus]|uniref:Uncharacterized protein n=1 Tax=Furculomyces boomerangus TaxID=61424 RepID=A0A2T9Y5D0_9FUNG|nr:hypothetical protein BB559_005988 [Furculomyces boomerangus]
MDKKSKRYSAWVTPQEKEAHLQGLNAENSKPESNLKSPDHLKQSSIAANLKKKLMRRSMIPNQYTEPVSLGSKYMKPGFSKNKANNTIKPSTEPTKVEPSNK